VGNFQPRFSSPGKGITACHVVYEPYSGVLESNLSAGLTEALAGERQQRIEERNEWRRGNKGWGRRDEG
jgi:hypothetical protein